MTLRKLRQISKATGKFPAGGLPRIAIRGRSAEGFVGRPAGLHPQPPKFDQRDLQRALAPVNRSI
jgi:hypothetical protein